MDLTAKELAAECPSCGAEVYANDRFCEACGSDLPERPGHETGPAAAPTPADTPQAHPSDGDRHDCGGTFHGGWCDTCGTRAPDPRDHVETEVAGGAGVSDRGLRHHRNEDAMALVRLAGHVVGVVADGVSATVDPQHASSRAVEAASRSLAERLTGVEPDPTAALVASHRAAVAAVDELTWTPRPDLGAPSCTFLAGVVGADGPIWVASLGDCRAYWLDGAGARLLTADDSWAAEQVREGRLTEAQADADPRAHVITRWVGEDADRDWQPAVSRHDVGAGRLVLCTDGLWNHLAETNTLADLVDPAASPLDVAAELVRFANAAGGHDNVTVVVIDRPVTEPAASEMAAHDTTAPEETP